MVLILITLLVLSVGINVIFKLSIRELRKDNESLNDYISDKIVETNRLILTHREELEKVRLYNFKVGAKFYLPGGSTYKEELLGKEFIITSISGGIFKCKLTNSADDIEYNSPIEKAVELIYVSNNKLEHHFVKPD